MKKMLLLSILLISFSRINAQTSTGKIQGIITLKSTGEALPFVRVMLFQDSTHILGNVSSDFDGNYSFSSLLPGTYTIKIHSVDVVDKKIDGVIVFADRITTLNIVAEEPKQFEIQEIQIVAYKTPLISYDGSTAHVIANDSRRNYSTKVRGSRSDNSTTYYEQNNESYSKINDNTFKAVKKEPLSTFSIDVDRASYSNIRRFIHQGSLPPADVVRVEEMINYFKYDYPQPIGKDPFSITTEYTDCPWNKDHKLIHIGLQGKQISMEKASANNFVFLIDVSGSMQSADKLDLLKSGLYLLVDQLREQDKVAIVVYAGAAGVVLPSTSGINKEDIKKVLEQLTAGGSTAGGQGIELAYKIAKENFIEKGNNRVILATDGDFNVGISNENDLTSLIENKRTDNIFLTVLGFGTGNIQDSKMELLADKGNGNYSYIDNILEAKKVLVTEMGGTLVTIAKDVKIQTEFNPKYVKAYRLVGYENRALNNEDFNDDKKDAGEIGAGHTVTAIYEIIPTESKETVSNVDPLKYQKEHSDNESATTTNEVMTIKFRYKNPTDETSQLITKVVSTTQIPFAKASENCKFSCAVAEFGMLLRNSEFKGDANYTGILELAKSNKGKDDDGYRAEFIRLVETAELMNK